MFTRIAVISSHLDNTEGKLLIDTGEIMRRFSKKSSINNTVCCSFITFMFAL